MPKHWYMTFPWKRDPSMQIQLRRVVRRKTLTLPKSHTVTWPSSPFNPTIHPAPLHPSIPVSTAFAFSPRIKPLTLTFALFPSSQPVPDTLSHVSLPSFNTQFASNTSSRQGAKKEEPTCKRTSSEDCVYPRTLCLIWIVLPEENISVKGKENSRRSEEDLG